jgi:hypothetical protein
MIGTINAAELFIIGARTFSFTMLTGIAQWEP